MTTPSEHPLDVSGLLTAEYEYISQTAAEAHADRARISSFYLIAVGSLVAALFGAQVFDEGKFTQITTILLSVIFFLLTFLGTSTIIQLARLRVAWRDSMLAMNRIKEYAIKHVPDLKDAYLWKTDSLPLLYKKKSISYFQAMEVSVISGLMLGTAVFFFLFAIWPTGGVWQWVISMPIGIIMVLIELDLYKRNLK